MKFASFVLMYVLIRILSFITYNNPLVNQLMASAIVLAFIYVCFKNLKLGWLMLIAELLLDGAGHFFELKSFLLRTWFLGLFGIMWLISISRHKKIFFITQKEVFVIMLLLLMAVTWSAVNGFLLHNSSNYIVQDTILYFFLLLIFPAMEFENITRKPIALVLKAWILASAFFSLLSFFIYTSGIARLPDLYYRWFRNMAAGKITDLGENFFRIVLPDHIIVVPIILVLTAYLIQQPRNKKLWAMISCCIVIITLNFSRIYWLGLIIGTLVLAFRHQMKRWLAISSIVLVSVPLLFSSLYFISSRGHSVGLELLGLRIGGVTTMQTDTSGAIRLAILPDIFRTIRARPWLGSGLGTTVSYIDPVSQQSVIRSQFDWGYLEMITKLGIIGTIIFFIFLFTILHRVARVAYSATIDNDTPLIRGLFAGSIALLVMNITTPALFQGFGIMYIVLMLVAIQKKDHVS